MRTSRCGFMVLVGGIVTLWSTPGMSGDANCDGDVTAADLPALIRLIATEDQAPCGRFPATGQTACWDSGGDAIPCGGTGHDGEVRAGAWLRYVDNDNGTITDTNTGLVWEKKDDNDAGSVHDWDDGYTWDDTFSVFIDRLNNYCHNDEATSCTKNADCVGAPDTYASNDLCGFAGYRDWRMPNVKELQSIIDYERSGLDTADPAFNSACGGGCTVTSCSCTALSYYWSSTTYAFSPTHAWYVYFYGLVNNNQKDSRYHARAVRGG